MPRYKAGTHRGLRIIREYTGTGSGYTQKETSEKGRDFFEKNKNLERYEQYKKAKEVVDAELTRRHITAPAGFKLCHDTSPHNMDFWKQQVPCSNNYKNENQYIDSYGFNVKTRGEMLVSAALKELGLDAKYEPELTMRNGRKRTPDYSFAVPVIDRCFYVEFMGMADDGSYLNKNFGKIDEYMQSGIFPNRDLIIICGTEKWLPSLEDMKQIIASFINNAVSRVYGQYASGHSN